ADAVDGRRVPRRLTGDRRRAAAERVRFRVADAPGVGARSGLRGARRRARRIARSAALAATAALAVLCFVKVVGLVLLGPLRRQTVADAAEAPVPMCA